MLRVGRFTASFLATAAMLLIPVLAGATITSTPGTLNFGSVPLNTQLTLPANLTVDAGYSVQVASGGLNAPFSFDFGSCGAPGNCTVQESFLPTSMGSFSDTLNVFECPTAGGACLSVSIPLFGTGISVLAADPGILNFGMVPLNTQVTLPIDITVDTGYSVQVASGGLNAPFSFDFGGCGSFGGPGDCTVLESFMPGAIGSFSDTLNIYECPIAGGACLSVGIPLFGTGYSAFAANPASVDFGSVVVNTQVTQPIDITVDAGYAVQVASGGLNPPFSFDFGSCIGSGTGPGECTVNESFLPTSIGSSSDTLNLFECPTAGGQCLSLGIPLSGAGIAQPTSTPEPAGLLLVGAGAVVLMGRFRRRK